ncbi:hypothetical protein H310_05545 [Aphanomyces invadans]|uniref:Uncharacterized protein n=1 Tax=Aphanomyces invadans TaxID=157072 RepID=A0A024U9L4_9STRA|nr:hypothetical protein H310_05545 [Aphanomyces invadans]ETW03121.1 hypothetical protein H310_05545 [Aphanomyces invadans]|eukprot:XP_008868505.1 hypothetical protein H310_05545 [Aphanomyces invadans]
MFLAISRFLGVPEPSSSMSATTKTLYQTPFNAYSAMNDFELGPPPPLHMTPKLVRQVAMDVKLTSTYSLPTDLSVKSSRTAKLCIVVNAATRMA